MRPENLTNMGVTDGLKRISLVNETRMREKETTDYSAPRKSREIIMRVICGGKRSVFLKMGDLQCVYTLMEMIKLERKSADAADKESNCWSVSAGRWEKMGSSVQGKELTLERRTSEAGWHERRQRGTDAGHCLDLVILACEHFHATLVSQWNKYGYWLTVKKRRGMGIKGNRSGQEILAICLSFSQTHMLKKTNCQCNVFGGRVCKK